MVCKYVGKEYTFFFLSRYTDYVFFYHFYGFFPQSAIVPPSYSSKPR